MLYAPFLCIQLYDVNNNTKIQKLCIVRNWMYVIHLVCRCTGFYTYLSIYVHITYAIVTALYAYYEYSVPTLYTHKTYTCTTRITKWICIKTYQLCVHIRSTYTGFTSCILLLLILSKQYSLGKVYIHHIPIQRLWWYVTIIRCMLLYPLNIHNSRVEDAQINTRCLQKILIPIGYVTTCTCYVFILMYYYSSRVHYFPGKVSTVCTYSYRLQFL
jgi:hypothetical protein